VVRKKEDAFHRYLRKWYSRHVDIKLWLKREEYEVLKKLADSKNMTVKAFLLDIANQVVSIEKEKNELMNKLKLMEKSSQLVEELKKKLNECNVYERCCREKEKDYKECINYLNEYKNYVESYNVIEQRNKELEKRLRELESRNKVLNDKLVEVVRELSSVINDLCIIDYHFHDYRGPKCKQWKDKFESIKDMLRNELHIYL